MITIIAKPKENPQTEAQKRLENVIFFLALSDVLPLEFCSTFALNSLKNKSPEYQVRLSYMNRIITLTTKESEHINDLKQLLKNEKSELQRYLEQHKGSTDSGQEETIE